MRYLPANHPWTFGVLCSLSLASVCAGCQDLEVPGFQMPSGDQLAITATPTSARNVVIRWAPQPEGLVVVRRKTGEIAYEIARKVSGAAGHMLDLALKPATTYTYQFSYCSVDETSCELMSELSVTTPETRLPRMTVGVHDERAQDDLTVFGLFDVATGPRDHRLMAAVAKDGTVVWEYALDKKDAGPVTEVAPLVADHALLVGTNAYLVKLDLDGTELFHLGAMTAQHDIKQLEDGRYMFLAFDSFQTQEYGLVAGDQIVIWNPVTGRADWTWRFRDHVPVSVNDHEDITTKDPFGYGQDWTHANSFTFDQNKHQIYLNVRNLNSIYAIDYPSGDIAWVMGDQGSFGQGIWAHSHDPQFISPGHVLMFDNGLHRAGGGKPYSRVIEVAYDVEAKSAKVVWTYRESPDFYSFALGGAHVQPNGNVFITDGINGRLLEVTRGGQKVWEMKLDGTHWIYKAESVPRSMLEGW